MSDDLNEYGERLIQFHYRAREEKDIFDFLEEVVINGQDTLKEKRVMNMRRHTLLPERGVGETIRQCIDEKF